jgi:hypothetical protein
MDQLKELGITDDLANSVMSDKRREQNLQGWALHCKESEETEEPEEAEEPEATNSASVRETQDLTHDDEMTAWGVLIVIALIVLELLI